MPKVSRATIGLIMGSIALVIAWLAAAAWPDPVAGLPVTLFAALIVVAVSFAAVWRSVTVRRAWGRMCLVNGILSALLAVNSIAAHGLPSASEPGYEQEIGRTMGPMPPSDVILHYAIVGAATVAAAALILTGLWLLHRDRQGPRHA